MSDYDNKITSSDLDAFKHSGPLETELVISGSIGAGVFKSFSTATIAVTDPDYGQFYFDHSDLHDGEFRNLAIDRSAHIYSTTDSLYNLVVLLEAEVETDGVRFIGRMFNTSAGSVSVRTTTITFRYVPYEDTIGEDIAELENIRVTSGGDTRVTDDGDTRITVV